MDVFPGIWRHFKGKTYRVICVARHSETQEEFVVYEALYDNPVSRYWIRPLPMFTETVMVKGKRVPRFERVTDGTDPEGRRHGR